MLMMVKCPSRRAHPRARCLLDHETRRAENYVLVSVYLCIYAYNIEARYFFFCMYSRALQIPIARMCERGSTRTESAVLWCYCLVRVYSTCIPLQASFFLRAWDWMRWIVLINVLMRVVAFVSSKRIHTLFLRIRIVDRCLYYTLLCICMLWHSRSDAHSPRASATKQIMTAECILRCTSHAPQNNLRRWESHGRTTTHWLCFRFQ